MTTVVQVQGVKFVSFVFLEFMLGSTVQPTNQFKIYNYSVITIRIYKAKPYISYEFV